MKTQKEIVDRFIAEGGTIEEIKALVLGASINCNMCHRPRIYVDIYYKDNVLKVFSLCESCLRLFEADPSFKEKVVNKIARDELDNSKSYS